MRTSYVHTAQISGTIARSLCFTRMLRAIIFRGRFAPPLLSPSGVARPVAAALYPANEGNVAFFETPEGSEPWIDAKTQRWLETLSQPQPPQPHSPSSYTAVRSFLPCRLSPSLSLLPWLQPNAAVLPLGTAIVGRADKRKCCLFAASTPTWPATMAW